MDIKVLESDCSIEKWVLLKIIEPEKMIFFRCWDSAKKATQELRKIGVDYEKAVIKMVVLPSSEALIIAGGDKLKRAITDRAWQSLLKSLSKKKSKQNKGKVVSMDTVRSANRRIGAAKLLEKRANQQNAVAGEMAGNSYQG